MVRMVAWFVGARGSVTTVPVGAAAIGAGCAPPARPVTALPVSEGVPLIPVDERVFGGHDAAPVPLLQRAEALAAAG